MNVTPTNFTVAEYCQQMTDRVIYPNKDYQRSSTVWPVAARSFLIDTILNGYPIPKITLFQKTDLVRRVTIKEIVDGQQRSHAILDFFNNHLRITGSRSAFRGQRFSSLDDETKHRFISYPLSVDLIVNATNDDIRQMFRRINSYTVPLNPQEQRHAHHQGDFKWFIISLLEDYAGTLSDMGVLREQQIARMQDAQFFTEICLALVKGIRTYSKALLDGIYSEFDASFPQSGTVQSGIDEGMSAIIGLRDIHGTALMKREVFYSMLLASIHSQSAVAALGEEVEGGNGIGESAAANLSQLAAALEAEAPPRRLQAFVNASTEATNTQRNRLTRFRWLCKALQEERL